MTTAETIFARYNNFRILRLNSSYLNNADMLYNIIMDILDKGDNQSYTLVDKTIPFPDTEGDTIKEIVLDYDDDGYGALVFIYSAEDEVSYLQELSEEYLIRIADELLTFVERQVRKTSDNNKTTTQGASQTLAVAEDTYRLAVENTLLNELGEDCGEYNLLRAVNHHAHYLNQLYVKDGRIYASSTDTTDLHSFLLADLPVWEVAALFDNYQKTAEDIANNN